ncbi:hypothetical protein K501DRAFT_273200 [Backusella circina FSU 941]|nr:hypothetical protein K501DRAFT_273200 [Backusella circina FSU 941]
MYWKQPKVKRKKKYQCWLEYGFKTNFGNSVPHQIYMYVWMVKEGLEKYSILILVLYQSILILAMRFYTLTAIFVLALSLCKDVSAMPIYPTKKPTNTVIHLSELSKRDITNAKVSDNAILNYNGDLNGDVRTHMRSDGIGSISVNTGIKRRKHNHSEGNKPIKSARQDETVSRHREPGIKSGFGSSTDIHTSSRAVRNTGSEGIVHTDV